MTDSNELQFNSTLSQLFWGKFYTVYVYVFQTSVPDFYWIIFKLISKKAWFYDIWNIPKNGSNHTKITIGLISNITFEDLLVIRLSFKYCL